MARQADEIALKIVTVCKECKADPETTTHRHPITGVVTTGSLVLMAMEAGQDGVPYYLCAACWLKGYLEAQPIGERPRAVGIVVP